MTSFLFSAGSDESLVLIAQTGARRARARPMAPVDGGKRVLVATADVGERTGEILSPSEMRQLAERDGLGPIVDDARRVVAGHGQAVDFPTLDKQDWSLTRLRLASWSSPELTVLRIDAPSLPLQALEETMRHGRLNCDVETFLETRALEEIAELHRHAMESRLDSLQALASSANGEPAQHEILRLAKVAEAAAKLETTTASAAIKSALRDIVAACEAATATMSASISAALLMIQHRVDQSEGLRREALERGQRRLSAAAAALVLPTLVIGVAGANFITPADDDQTWLGALTFGVALLSAASGIGIAHMVSNPQSNSPKLLHGAIWIGIVGCALAALIALA